MKEVVGIRTNHHAIISDKGMLVPSVEVILLASEPTYSFESSGTAAQSRPVETFRFASSPDQLRQISALFASLASESEQQISEAIAKSAPARQ